jgi:hypothetical protein
MQSRSGKFLASLCLSLGFLAACRAAPTQSDSAKIDPQVSAAAQALAQGGQTGMRIDAQGRLLVYVYVTDTRTETLRQLADAGLTDPEASPEMSVVQGWIAPTSLGTLAALTCVKGIAAPRFAISR